MRSPNVGRRVVRHLLTGVPVVLVLAVLSAAAVVGIVHRPPAPLTSDDVAAAGLGASEPPAPSPPRPTATDLDQPPAELVGAGTYATATVLPNGDIAVVEWVRTPRPSGSLTLSLPLGSPPGGAAREVAVVTADGSADGPTTVTSSGTYLPARASTLFAASYLLKGAARISPSSQTRALIRPVALDLKTSGRTGDGSRGPRLLRIEAGEVLALACAIPGSEETLTPCGVSGDEGWSVELGPDDWSTLVAAQVELE